MKIIKTVLAGFFGVRSRQHAEGVKIKPLQLIIVGLACAAVLVLALIGLARYLVAQGGGQ
mgnify:CR=1 FL=1